MIPLLESSKVFNHGRAWEPNGFLKSSPLTVQACSGNANEDPDDVSLDDDEESNQGTSRMDLDSHANMAVVDKHALIVSDAKRMAQVCPFALDYEALEEVSIVDVATQCSCLHKN